MLIRLAAVPIIAALLAGLAPPLTGEASAAAPRWIERLARDYLEARRVTRGQGVKIALLSDGVAPGVKTLAGAVGKGRDFVKTPRPRHVTGTLMASLIVGGGPTAGSLGVRGLASGAKLMPIRVYPDVEEPGAREWWDSEDVATTIAHGIRHAADSGAQVIAVDLWVAEDAGTIRGGMIQAAVAHARRKNAVVVAASGVFRRGDAGFPAAAAGVLGVGAVEADGRRYKKFTGATTSISVAAPGSEHIAIGPGNRPYTVWGGAVALTWGTSVAALVKSEYPKLTPSQVVEAITSSARHPKGKGRYDTQLGYGYLNAIGALNKAKAISERESPSAAPQPVVKDATYLGGEERPGPIRAVPFDPAILGGFGGLMFGGLVAVMVGALVALRRPSRPATGPPVPPTAPVPLVPPVAEPRVDGPESPGASGS